jgi:hypothetical protein
MITSKRITDSVFREIDELGLFKTVEHDIIQSIRIIMEAKLDAKFELLQPRQTILRPTLVINEYSKSKCKASGSDKKTVSCRRFKIKYLDVLDELLVEDRFDRQLKDAVKYYKFINPGTDFSFRYDKGHIICTRIK